MSKVMRALGCAFLSAISLGAMSADEIKNWTAPPYWSGPVRIPEKTRGEIETQAIETLTTSPVPFVAIAPCRIVDTRGADGPFGGPALVANASRTFNLPAGPCPGLPADATAWSLNFTVIGGSGVFTNAFLTAWPTGDAQPTVSTLNFNASQLEANAAVVAAGTSGSINVFVNAPAHLLIDINGYYIAVPVVNTINSLSADVTLAAGSNVTITPSGQTLTIGATGAGLPSGTANQTLRHDGSNWVASSALQNNGTDVSLLGNLNVQSSFRIIRGGSHYLHGTGNNNFLGSGAGNFTATGNFNNAVGVFALKALTSGLSNTVIGDNALANLTNGSGNTAVGAQALGLNVTGSQNTAVGLQALNKTTGNNNIGLGIGAGSNNTGGFGNIYIGNSAGTAISTGSNNILIGNAGFNNESGQIRIGTVEAITSGTVIVGISGFGSSGGIPVIVNGGGRLGTNQSSARYKEDIRDIDAKSDDLMKLRPVVFQYKESHEPGGLQQYGLIAEEVAKVYPELVVNDEQGRPQAIRSQLLDPLLLNELQKQRRTIDQQRAELEAVKAKLEKLEALLEKRTE